jgi:hypothetical protein
MICQRRTIYKLYYWYRNKNNIINFDFRTLRVHEYIPKQKLFSYPSYKIEKL